ncbi:hypothetical protein AABB87_11220 [Roseateles sp. PN1]
MRLNLLMSGDQLGLDVEGDAGEMAAFGIDGKLPKAEMMLADRAPACALNC